MKWAPVVLFVYKRPHHTRRTVEALQRNEGAAETDLVIFSDAPKDEASSDPVASVRKYCAEIRGFRSVRMVKRQSHCGLASSVISGVSEVLKQQGRAIVVEDDILTSRYFLKFINDALRTYEGEERVMSVTGMSFPIKVPLSYRKDVYLSYRSSSWGWATWQDRWSKVDWKMSDYDAFLSCRTAQRRFNRGGADLTEMLQRQMAGKIDSWAILWAYAHFKLNAYCLFPVKSLVQNIGSDGSGTHCPAVEEGQSELFEPMQEYRISLPLPLQPNRTMLKRFRAYQNRAFSRRRRLFLQLTRKFYSSRTPLA